MIAPDALEPDSKMMIYKIHQLRVLISVILLTTTTVLFLVLNVPRDCVRVSVSVQQWRLHPVKRTRVVQGLEDGDGEPSERMVQKGPSVSINSAWFRTRIILPSSHSLSKDEEDDFGEDEELEEEKEEDEYDEYGEYDVQENKIFEDGDFDYNETDNRMFSELNLSVISRIFHVPENHSSSNGSSQEIGPADLSSRNGHQKFPRRRWRRITLVNVEGVPIVEDGIFWSEELEKQAPKGATDEEAESALKKLRSLSVQRVEPPTWNRCGRPKNQFIVFEDGSKACARYRAPHQYLVQGEVLSFYLSRLLGINNVPAVTLAAFGPGFQGMWRKDAVKKALIASKWEFNTTIALIQWIDNLERDRMPLILLSSLENKEPLSAKSPFLLTLLSKRLTELLQWSDLIVFDYITGNYDRVASMQDAADKESKPSILRETVHNLVRSKSTGGLWLIDNESGLLDSYSLLYGRTGKDSRFINFHRRMLNATCLFRRRTVERIRWLHASNRTGQILMDLVKQLEPLFTAVKREKEVGRRLQERIAEVHEHIERCSASFS